jgi:hypothetical protein
LLYWLVVGFCHKGILLLLFGLVNLADDFFLLLNLADGFFVHVNLADGFFLHRRLEACRLLRFFLGILVFLCEHGNYLISVPLLFNYRLKLFGDVENVIWTNKRASVILTLAVDTLSSDELLIKHYHYLLFSLADHGSAEAERNVTSHGGIHVHYSVTNLEVLRCPWTKWRSPVGESLSEKLPRL